MIDETSPRILEGATFSTTPVGFIEMTQSHTSAADIAVS
jgi:hypothetical protein